jgi:putative transposase
MARPLRAEFPNAIYHVTSRGIERRAIVRDPRDRDRWVGQLEHVVEIRRWRLFAFALMDNHFHLFVQTPEANLSAGMRDLNGGYVSFFNARHRRAGHLFQGRFKAFLVEEEGYWLEVSRYVHLNPVRAGLAAKPEAWTWSSYAGYHRPARRLGWVDYARVLEEFGGDTAAGRRRYREFVEAGLRQKLESPFSSALHGFVLGSERFVNRIRDRVGRRPDDPEIPLLARFRPRTELSEVIAVVTEHYGSDPSTWAPGHRCDDPARNVAAYLGREVAGRSNREIADALGYRNTSSVSAACRRIRSASARSRLARDLRQLVRRLHGGH